MHKKSIKYVFKNKLYCFNYNFLFLISMNFKRITFSQLESARRVIVRNSIKKSFSSIRINPFFLFTKKANKSRMGKGIGVVKSIEYILKPGMVVFETISFSYLNSFKYLIKASNKLPGEYRVLIK